MLSDPTPVRVAGACAAAVRSGMGGSWAGCGGEPVLAAEWVEPHTRHRWLVFACADHRDLFDGARPLTDADRRELESRREAEARALRGERWVPPQPLR